MENIKENISKYVNGWNEPSPEKVKAAFQECLAPEVTYTDKTTPKFEGINKLVDLVMSSWEKIPGRSFSLETEPECFEGQGYYTWGAKFPGQELKNGHDFIEYNEAGLITRIVGFLPVA